MIPEHAKRQQRHGEEARRGEGRARRLIAANGSTWSLITGRAIRFAIA